jgi:hypothetical protein
MISHSRGECALFAGNMANAAATILRFRHPAVRAIVAAVPATANREVDKLAFPQMFPDFIRESTI